MTAQTPEQTGLPDAVPQSPACGDCGAETSFDGDHLVCEDCQLCFNDKALLERDSIIAFRVHSQIKKRALTVLQEKSPCRSSTASSSRSP